MKSSGISTAIKREREGDDRKTNLLGAFEGRLQRLLPSSM